MSVRSIFSSHRRLAAGSVVVAVAVAGLTGLATSSLFTDTVTPVAAGPFTTGDVDLTTDSPSYFLTVPAMAPGDKVWEPITVTNEGSLDLRYAVTSDTTEDVLAAQLAVTIKTVANAGTCVNQAGFDAGSAVVGPVKLGVVLDPGFKLIGDAAQGDDIGDRVLPAGDPEVLCVQVELPVGSGNSFMNLTSTATLTFSAEQTDNNA